MPCKKRPWLLAVDFMKSVSILLFNVPPQLTEGCHLQLSLWLSHIVLCLTNILGEWKNYLGEIFRKRWSNQDEISPAWEQEVLPVSLSALILDKQPPFKWSVGKVNMVAVLFMRQHRSLKNWVFTYTKWHNYMQFSLALYHWLLIGVSFHDMDIRLQLSAVHELRKRSS
jgi:hypothetical protein